MFNGRRPFKKAEKELYSLFDAVAPFEAFEQLVRFNEKLQESKHHFCDTAEFLNVTARPFNYNKTQRLFNFI